MATFPLGTSAHQTTQEYPGPPHPGAPPRCSWCALCKEIQITAQDRVLGELQLCDTCAATHEILEATRGLPARALHDTCDLLLVIAASVHRFKREACPERQLIAQTQRQQQIEDLQRQITLQQIEISRLQARIAEMATACAVAEAPVPAFTPGDSAKRSGVGLSRPRFCNSRCPRS